MEEFLEAYKGKISNQRVANLKREFIRVIEILSNKIISSGQPIVTNELTIQNISEGFIVYEKISSSKK